VAIVQPYVNSIETNPDGGLWYGRSEMKRDLTEIKTMAQEMRRDVKKKK
jgi:hypothetical protein